METVNRLEITARYAETDMMGIIHHSVYPIWFEAARTEFIKMADMTYSQLEQQGVMLPLVNLECHYIAPVHYEDRVIVETIVTELTFAKIRFAYRVLLEGRVMCEGSTLHGFVDSQSFKPINIKKAQPGLYEKFKALVTTGW